MSATARKRSGRPSRYTGELVPPVLPKDPAVAQRVKTAWRMASEGALIREISEALGVGPSAVSRYLNDPDGAGDVKRKLAYAGTCVDCGARTSGTASGLDRVPERCVDCQHYRDKNCIVCRIHKGHIAQAATPQTWSDEEIVDAVRACAGEDGIATVKRYRDLYAARPKGSMPSLPILIKRFDTWNAVCVAAGVSHGTAPRTYKRTSVDDCLSAVVYVAQEIGRLPTYTEYAVHSRAAGLPSASLVRNRVGTWTSVLEALTPGTERQAA